MGSPRSARLELRVTPGQKELIARAASRLGETTSEYAVEVLVRAALRDDLDHDLPEGALGWMRGTATLIGDIVGPTEPGGWVPRDMPE